MPHYGYLPQNRWDGHRPFDTNRLDRPTGGIVGNTNNKITNAPFPAHVSFSWNAVSGEPLAVNANPQFTRDSFIRSAKRQLPVTLRSHSAADRCRLWFTEAAPAGTPAPRRAGAAGWMNCI
jgi:penicillin amidase